MMTNNMLYNINGNKNSLNKLDEQYSTGLKIQRPSDDPIVAVRALKLRTNLAELDQYYERNIKDAKSWMETTESALTSTSEIITQLHTYCVQGATDTLTKDDRANIGANLVQLVDQINQQGNANYAGRYVFTGYKTNTSLVFAEDEETLDYTITERKSFDNIEILDRITNTVDLTEFDLDDVDSFDTTSRAESRSIYRLQLAYDTLKNVDDEDDPASISIKIPAVDEDGEFVYDDEGNLQYEDEYTENDLTVLNSTDTRAYNPDPDEIIFLEDTGEVIIGSSIYEKLRDRDLEITYEKNSFKKNELKPEHYFDCDVLDLKIEDEDVREEKMISYRTEDQRISYEISFNQKMQVNVQGKEAFRHELGRCVDDIVGAVTAVDFVKGEVAKVEKYMLEEGVTEEQKAKLAEIKDMLETELDLKEGLLRKQFDRGIRIMGEQEGVVNESVSDIGTRYSRVELTESRLATQQVEFTDLMSQNEDADIVETVVNYNAMQTVYNASLSAASKVVQNTLLDYLR